MKTDGTKRGQPLRLANLKFYLQNSHTSSGFRYSVLNCSIRGVGGCCLIQAGHGARHPCIPEKDYPERQVLERFLLLLLPVNPVYSQLQPGFLNYLA